MNELQRGTLKVMKKVQKTSFQVLIDGKPFNLAQGQLSSNLTPTDGMEVEFVRVGGQPREVRPVGKPFIAPQETQAVQKGHPKHGANTSVGKPLRSGSSEHSRQGQTEAASQQTKQRSSDKNYFHNPYNFVPAPPRNTEHPELGDRPLVQQDSFDTQRYTGRIRVRMIVKTPVLVPDTDPTNVQEEANGHKTFKLRVDGNGLPAIPSSNIRGMLRSAYEIITNSRFGRLSRSHQNRLAFRMDARESLRLIPARIENGRIQLLTGTSQIGSEGRPNGPMYAAWLPRYWNGQIDRNAIRHANHGLPVHGEAVVCWIERMRRSYPNFEYWRVKKIAPGNDFGHLGEQPDPSASIGKSAVYLPSEMKSIQGWVCVTNANINRKHDERVFFVDPKLCQPPFELTEELKKGWQELIKNYQDIHEEDVHRRKLQQRRYDEYFGSEPGQTAWSRHVYTLEDRELSDGTLCYIRLNADNSDIEAIFPVMISRELYSKSPWDLLNHSLRPATSIDELSPADRVFGWVRTDGDKDLSKPDNENVAVRGLLRVGPVICKSSIADAVESFPSPGVPLAILSAPKPQQGRFYVAESSNGKAQNDNLSKVTAGYSIGKGLRGRKVYPHQKNLPASHWENPSEDRTQTYSSTGYYQEYRHPQKRDGSEQRDDQNRSILAWIKPGAEFTFDLHVQNLSKVELGALLWLLDFGEGCYFRLGGGKPLGFGSVRLTIDEYDLLTGHQLRSRYTAWNHEELSSDPSETTIGAFKKALLEAYPAQGNNGFEDIPFIKAFLVACKGFSNELPVHYPRTTPDGQSGPPSRDGESFKWFVANEKSEARYVLPDLVSEKGLPTLQNPQQGRGGSEQRGRR